MKDCWGWDEQTLVRVAKAPTWQPEWQENRVWWVSLGEAGKSPTLAGLPHYTAQACPLQVSMGTRGPDKGLGLFSSRALGPGPFLPAWSVQAPGLWEGGLAGVAPGGPVLPSCQ